MGKNALVRAACGWVGAIGLVVVASGCGDDRPATTTDGVIMVTEQPVETGEHIFPVGSSCTSGRTAFCKVIVGRHADVVNCFVGVQHCIDDAWGPCVEADAGAEEP